MHTVLEKAPQGVGQWNIELTLETVGAMPNEQKGPVTIPFSWCCKLIEMVLKKHRHRLEGHYHLLTTALEEMLTSLLRHTHSASSEKALTSDNADAQSYRRLITLVCEPTTGAVSRLQQHSALDSATDTAKRSAGKHMYLVLMQYVKLQLETDVMRSIRDALEPAMNTIFDITPPEGRKILNDGMDASGRAILKDMFKRYSRHGKWTGV